MKLSELAGVPDTNQARKRVGRGTSSGHGKTAGKGHKGQKSRSGKGFRAGFEGGQMPLMRRLPKRGFNNIFAKTYVSINLDRLDLFEEGAVIDEAALLARGVVKNARDGIKILGRGEVSKKFEVKVSAISASAREKIEKAGGKVEVV